MCQLKFVKVVEDRELPAGRHKAGTAMSWNQRQVHWLPDESVLSCNQQTEELTNEAYADTTVTVTDTGKMRKGREE